MKLPALAQLKPRERLLAVGSVAVLLLVMLDRLVVSPWSRHGQTVRQEIARMEEALKNHHRLLERKDRVMRKLERYQRYLKPAVTDDLQMAALLKEVEEIATETNVHVIEIKPLTVEAGERVTRYALEARFECKLDAWTEFVYRVEASPSLFQVVRAGLSVREEKPDRLEGYLRVASVAVPAKPARAHADAGSAHAIR